MMKLVAMVCSVGWLWAHVAMAEIYKWVDADGTVHYGDEPVNAQLKPMKDLPDLSTYAPRALVKPAVPVRPQAEPGPISQTAPSQHLPDFEQASIYQAIKVISPEAGQRLEAGKSTLPVFLVIEPVLRKGDYLKLMLDGRELAQRYDSSFLRLPMPGPGEHSLQVMIYDRQGERLLESSETRFSVH